ncbi:hypothetical protein RhiirA1_543130 [Rhizophagus irregularis]|uniref:Uncharacterized protein n=1 Tax=Rhizophagus irregularis TaxID=588596 RepID=A0A2N0QRF2_9GLOM|nr:hypothetical protein RhiirA1_543130 [Rhizophagus irregularis]
MSLSNIQNFTYNIFKKLGDDIVKDKEFTELAKCPECDKNVLSPDFEAFTVLSCRHIFHKDSLSIASRMNSQLQLNSPIIQEEEQGLGMNEKEAEEMNETAHHGLISSYYSFGKELEKCLAHFRQTNKEYEALKKLYDEVKDQLLKEVTRYTLQKKADRARKVYDLFFRISDDKSQRALYIHQIKTITATSIAKLSKDEVKYIATKVMEAYQAP